MAAAWRRAVRQVTAAARGIRRGRPAVQRHPGGAGEQTGPFAVRYQPQADGEPDPGEVVWAWVPYEEDDGRGKDRPVLVVGRSGHHLLALQMSSKDHDVDAGDEARHGRVWMDVGTGEWDARARPSEVRLDRVLRLDAAAVRREGARLDRATFDEVAGELARLHDPQ